MATDNSIATLGMIGLGRMGGNMAERLRRGGHTVVGYDRAPDSTATSTASRRSSASCRRRALVWVMVPAGPPTYETIEALGELLEPGDVVVDGGNSRYTDDIRHAEDLAGKGIGFVDCGVSGGVWGLTEGYALMCGGEAEHVALVQPIFDTLKPEGESGFVHAGAVGAGHFAKMVHNGIEYGLMQAYAEGWELLEATDLVTDVREVFESLAAGHGHPVLAARPRRARARRRRAPGQAARLRARTPARVAGPCRPRSTTRCRCR